MEFDRRGLHHLETPRKYLPQAVMDGKGAAILNDNMAKLGKSAALGKAEHFERHVPDEPRRHRTGEIGKVGLGHLVIEGFVGDSCNGLQSKRAGPAISAFSGPHYVPLSLPSGPH